MPKYRNIKTEVDGFIFDSKKEASRYKHLKRLRDANEIFDLQLQPRYDFALNGHKICFYKADFRYVDLRTGETIVEDVKGVLTPMYRLKKKLMKAFYDIEVVEI